MSDFIGDLEGELLAAARRRATRRRRVRLPRPRPATVLALAMLAALVLAAVALVRGLEPSQTGDERPAAPPGRGVALALPAAEAARPCPGLEQRTEAGEAPQPSPLSIFTRPQTEPDAVPSLNGADSYSWIPAGTIFLDGARRPTPEQFDAELHLVPAAEPRQGGGCNREVDAVLGVCLTVGAGDVTVRCFSDEEIEGGRAIAVTGPGMVHGIAPDGIATVTLRWAGGSVQTAVIENAFEVAAPLRAGETVRVELEQVDACRPTPELLDAVPALGDGGWETLPAVAEDAMPTGGKRQWVRHLDRGELDVWVVARCDDAERACVLAIYDARWIAQPCGTAAEVRERGSWWLFPVARRLGVAGMAPHRATRVEVILDGRDVHDVPVTGGVFAAILPPAFGSSVDPGEGDMSGRLDIRFR